MTLDALWTVKELADYLGYSVGTVTHMVSQAPDRLPPRVAALTKPRWTVEAVKAWSDSQTVARHKVRAGRPRGS